MAVNDISLTSGMRSNLLSLQGTVDLLNRTQNRLSSGKKVNTAIDNPTSYFASQALTSRASIIDSMKDAMGQAVQTITAADKGITAITSMIEQAKGIAESALSADAGSSVDTGSITLDSITAAQEAEFATGKLTLTGATFGAGTGKDTGTITVTSFTEGGVGTSDVITIGGVTFTASTGSAVAVGAVDVDASGAGDIADAGAIADAINSYGWGAGATTYHATDNGDGTISVTKNNTADGSLDVVAASITINNLGGGASTEVVTDGGADKIVIGGLTFRAVSDNVADDSGDFLATGNDAIDKLSLVDAINSETGWGVNTYTAALNDDGDVVLTKTVTATAAGANYLANDTDTAASGGSAVETVIPAITGASDTIRIGTAASIGAASADANNAYAGTVTSSGAYTGGTDQTYLIDITTAATVASGNIVYQYSTDGGANWTAGNTVAASGVSTLADGISLTFTAGTASLGDKFTVSASAAQSITFTAVEANAGANEFLAGTNTISTESMKDAINAADWSGKTWTYSATVENGEINLTKTLTADDSAVAVSAADFAFTAGAGNTGTAAMDITAASGELSNLVSQYNELRTQLDELTADAGYKGKNLLNGATDAERTLTVKFEGYTLDVVGFDATTTGLGVTAADTGTTQWTAAGTAGTTAINASVTQLNAALDTLRQKSSALAGNLSIITVRQDFSTNMINTLTAGSDKLTQADANEEGANMLMLQTRQSLSTTALSLSAQAAQSVLKLFG